MAIQLQGSTGVVAEVAGTGFRALKNQISPLEYGTLGSYAVSQVSGTVGAGLAANSEIYQFRWTDATRLCVIHQVILDGVAGSATAFTAGFANITVTIARSWSAAGSGGTAASLTGNNQKLRTSMGTTILGESRCATTSALGAGTKTLDASPVGQIGFAVGTTASVSYLGQVFLFNGDPTQGHPIVLAQNEGIAVRATVPATGTWQFGVTVKWSEVNAF